MFFHHLNPFLYLYYTFYLIKSQLFYKINLGTYLLIIHLHSLRI
nr:MAG TPA: hypothetical protein [Caudoviricetes sp.]